MTENSLSMDAFFIISAMLTEGLSGSMMWSVAVEVAIAAVAVSGVLGYFGGRHRVCSGELTGKLQDIISEYNLLPDNMPVYFYVEDINDGFRHIKCNRICDELWGRPVSEALGLAGEELFGDAKEVLEIRKTDIIAAEADGRIAPEERDKLFGFFIQASALRAALAEKLLPVDKLNAAISGYGHGNKR